TAQRDARRGRQPAIRAGRGAARPNCATQRRADSCASGQETATAAFAPLIRLSPYSHFRYTSTPLAGPPKEASGAERERHKGICMLKCLERTRKHVVLAAPLLVFGCVGMSQNNSTDDAKKRASSPTQPSRVRPEASGGEELRIPGTAVAQN